MNRIVVTHFSDLLCVWAYVSQIRCDEILETFGEQVSMSCRFFSVFGDVGTKLGKGWAERGGLEGYAAHVQSAPKPPRSTENPGCYRLPINIRTGRPYAF